MSTDELRSHCRSVMEEAWRSEPGYCVPNGGVYPHQWLWDSCFHSVVWAELGDRRAVTELESALATQFETGFVPHMNYWSDPDRATNFWGRQLTSIITQPPMYGHAARAVTEAGFEVSADVGERVRKGLRYLLDRPRLNRLVTLIHPWESGCDDSPRWDDWCPGGFDRDRWRERKGRFVEILTRDRFDDAERFLVGSVGFSALVAWNCSEAEDAGIDCGGADGLIDSITDRWSPTLRTWADADSGSGTARTLDALLPLLVDPRDEAFDDLIDPSAYGAEFGPCGVHRDEPTFDPDTYWRGPNWPQLTYLLAVAARRAGRDDVAGTLADSLRRSAVRSGFAEYWNPDTGAGRGAAPQTWTALACVPI